MLDYVGSAQFLHTFELDVLILFKDCLEVRVIRPFLYGLNYHIIVHGFCWIIGGQEVILFNFHFIFSSQVDVLMLGGVWLRGILSLGVPLLYLLFSVLSWVH